MLSRFHNPGMIMMTNLSIETKILFLHILVTIFTYHLRTHFFDTPYTIGVCEHITELPKIRSEEVKHVNDHLMKVMLKMASNKEDSFSAYECGVPLRLIMFQNEFMLNPSYTTSVKKQHSCLSFDGEWFYLPSVMSVTYMEPIYMKEQNIRVEGKQQVCLMFNLLRTLQ